MFQWIAEFAASPPYQLMADGDQASRIAVEKGVAEHQTIDVLYSCQVKTFFFCTKLLSMHFCTGELFEEDLLLLMPMTPQSSRV